MTEKTRKPYTWAISPEQRAVLNQQRATNMRRGREQKRTVVQAAPEHGRPERTQPACPVNTPNSNEKG